MRAHPPSGPVTALGVRGPRAYAARGRYVTPLDPISPAAAAAPLPVRLLSRCSVHGISSHHAAHGAVAWGGDEAVYLPQGLGPDCPTVPLPNLEDHVAAAVLTTNGALVLVHRRNHATVWSVADPANPLLTGTAACAGPSSSAAASRDVLLSCALRPSDGAAVCGTAFGELIVWRAADDGARVASRGAAHRGALTVARWSAHAADQVATGGDDRTLRLWRVDASKNALEGLWAAPGHAGRIWDVAWARRPGTGASVLATASEDGTARVWDAADGAAVAVFKGHAPKRGVWCCAAVGDALATGGNDGAVKVWQLPPAAAPPVFPVPGASPVVSLDVLASSGGPVVVLVLTKGGGLYRCALPEGAWRTLAAEGDDNSAFPLPSTVKGAPCGARAAVGTARGALAFVNVAGPTSPLLLGPALGASPTGRRVLHLDWLSSAAVAACSADGVVTVAEAAGAAPLRRFQLPPPAVATAAALAPAARRLYTGDTRGSICVFDAGGDYGDAAPAAALYVCRRAHGASPVAWLGVLGNGRVRSGGFDGHVNDHAPARAGGTLQLVATRSAAPVASVEAVAAPEGDDGAPGVVCGYAAASFVAYDVATRRELLSLECGGWRRPHASAVDPATGAVAFVCLAPAARGAPAALRYAASAEVPRRLRAIDTSPHGRAVDAAAWCGGGELVLTASEDCTSALSRVDAGGRLRVERRLEAHESAVRAAAASAALGGGAPTLLATAGGKLQVRTWRLRGDDAAGAEVVDVFRVRVGGGNDDDNARQDHRVLALAVWSVGGEEHILAAGTSCGSVELVALSTAHGAPRAAAGTVACVEGTAALPVLCLAHVRLLDNSVVLVAGTTAGTVALYALPARGGDPPVPLWRYAAHAMGTNSLHAVLNRGGGGVVVASGGDDQALAVARVPCDGRPGACVRVERACSAAVHGAVLVDGGRALLSAGNDQRLSMWRVAGAEAWPTAAVTVADGPCGSEAVRMVGARADCLALDVGDVADLAVCGTRAVVTGEGCQVVDLAGE